MQPLIPHLPDITPAVTCQAVGDHSSEPVADQGETIGLIDLLDDTPDVQGQVVCDHSSESDDDHGETLQLSDSSPARQRETPILSSQESELVSMLVSRVNNEEQSVLPVLDQSLYHYFNTTLQAFPSTYYIPFYFLPQQYIICIHPNHPSISLSGSTLQLVDISYLTRHC